MIVLQTSFMREAHSLYRKWGAMAKAEHLEKRYPNWLVSRRISLDESGRGTTSSQLFGNLDFLTVLKTSQAIAGEIELERLLNALMSSAIENSGAQSGYLLLPEAGRWMIAAQANLDDLKLQFEQPIFINESGLLSQAVANYAIRTQETVLLEDASQNGEFVDDSSYSKPKCEITAVYTAGQPGQNQRCSLPGKQSLSGRLHA